MTCDLLDTRPGYCGWCSKKLTGRQTKWCSRHCNRMFVANHRWTQARATALKEAGAYYLCANANNWGFDGAGGFWNADHPDCLVFTQAPEVNHITPILGKHGQWGCWHHQTNLTVLCRPCHLAETKRQREAGLL